MYSDEGEDEKSIDNKLEVDARMSLGCTAEGGGMDPEDWLRENCWMRVDYMLGYWGIYAI